MDSGNNSSDTKKNYSKSTSSKESFTISITDVDTWAPLETAPTGKGSGTPAAAAAGGGAGSSPSNPPSNPPSSSSEQLSSESRSLKEHKDLTNLRESHSVSVVNETLTVTDIDSLIESGASSAG